MSQSKWLVAALVPGVERHPLKKFDAQEEGLLKLLHRWRNEAGQAGREIKRIVVAYEAGRDGFWLARWLRARDGGQKCAACEAEERKQEPPVKLSRKDSAALRQLTDCRAPNRPRSLMFTWPTARHPGPGLLRPPLRLRLEAYASTPARPQPNPPVRQCPRLRLRRQYRLRAA